MALLLETNDTLTAPIVIFSFLIIIAIPSLSVCIRRLHDIGKSGAWYLIKFIPFGNIVILFFMFKNGQPHDNEYGTDPKSIID